MYHYLWDVALGDGKQHYLPFNKGDNPIIAASKFCTRENLGPSFIENIRKWITDNTSDDEAEEEK